LFGALRVCESARLLRATGSRGDFSIFRYFSGGQYATLQSYGNCQIVTQVGNDLPRALRYETLEVTAYHVNLQNFEVSPGPKDFTFGAADWAIKK